ncbi:MULTISPECIES: hypothetical protein [Novosphingobium]|uniref:hypothetical protein n=1 Tax=Novosphingobium sp. TCA1 TaxID=2682474 RepID=UPI000A3B4B62|nr:MULTISPECIES: hypothetical protein [Novosphingobium]GFE74715.1 hypothetical protein NTCA1_23640 [Novosphingobium sp. TCA1]
MIDTRLSLMEAISFRRTVNARYNGGIIKLAPHLMFERHGDLFVSALNLTKAWRSPEERRLGQFKLAGLEVTELLEEVFEPLPDFEAAAPREDDTLLLTV